MPAVLRDGHATTDGPHPTDASDAAHDRALRALRHDDPAARCLAADVLAAYAARRAEDALIETLEDPHAAVREAGARALGRCGGAPALTALLAGLRARRLPLGSVRDALSALGRDADESLAAATLDGDELVRALAVRELGRRDSFEPALVGATRDIRPEVRAQAVLALAARGAQVGRAAAEAVIAAARDREPSVRAAACQALGPCAGRLGHAPLLALESDPDPWVASSARAARAAEATMPTGLLSAS
jgi:HEAT repeat protein